jgi:hypothetical protein
MSQSILSVTQLLPEARQVSVAAVAEALHAATAARQSPDHTAQAFCTTLSRLLLQDARARQHPDLQALGFWLRPANVERMLANYLSASPGCLAQPLGTVFMIPPANVDALFGYALAIALLCGNNVIIRLPSTETAAQATLCALTGDAMAQHPLLRQRLVLVRYGHDDAVTTALSLFCALRLVWGGDATVSKLAQIPLPPLARQIGFGDRFSASVIDATAHGAASEETRTVLVKNFYNDVYWYDQLACAAPRLLFWLGHEQDCVEFCTHLDAEARRRGYQPDAGASVAKLSLDYLALHDLPAEDYTVYSPALSTIICRDTASIASFKRVNYGYGTLIVCPVTSLAAIAAQASPHDQTLTHWGLSPEIVTTLAQSCGGRGYDRFVPVGQALQFDPIWDGHNLFTAMTKLMRVE